MCHAKSGRNVRFPVGGEENAIFGWMLVVPHLHIESILYLLDRSVDGHNHAIRRLTFHSQSLGFSECHDCLIVIRGRSKAICEIRYAQKMTIVGAGWIVNLLQQICELILIAKWEHDRQVQALRRREWA